MSLSDLFRKSRKAAALKQAALASTLVAGAVGFTMMTKAVDSNGNVIASTASRAATGAAASSSGAAGFATSNPALRPADSSSSSSSSSLASANSGLSGSNFDPTPCIKNPSVDNCLKNNNLTQSDWDKFLPPEGIVVYDNRGNVMFKKCRSLTEGAAAAQTEMNNEKARFDKFNAAMGINTSRIGGGGDNGNDGSQCFVSPTKMAPKMQPCPTYQNFAELRDYYRSQYYEMSNELQKRAAGDYTCGPIRDTVMAAVDSNWKSDRGIASEVKSASSATSQRGVR